MAAVVGSLRAELSATIAQFQKDLGKAADTVKGLSKQFSAVGKDFKRSGDQITSVGKSLTKTLTLPLAALGLAAGAAAKEFDDAFDDIRSGTGKTGAELDSLKQSFRTVFAEVPNSANEVAEAIASISSRTGAVGPELEKVATQIANLARLTKSNIGELAAGSTRAFGDWSIATEKQAESLDFLFRTSQQTGIKIQELTDLVVQFGAPMRALGFTFEQTAALLGKFEKEGVNLETVMSGLRFALGKFAEAGKDPAAAFAEITERIKAAGTESEATAIAFDAFGKRAAIDMSRAILEGRFNIDELVKSLKNSKDTINAAARDTLSFSEKFEILRHRVSAVLEPLGSRLLQVLEDLQPQFEAGVRLLQSLVDGFAALPKSVQTATIVLAGVAAAIGPIAIVSGQAITSLGLLAAAFGKGGIATKGIISGIGALDRAMRALRAIDIGSGMFSILAGSGAAAGGIGLGIAGMYLVAGELADNFRKKLEAQNKSTGLVAGATNQFGQQLFTLAEAQAKAAESGQELVDGLELTIESFKKAGGGSGGAGGGAQSFIDKLAAARAEIAALSPAIRRDLTAALESGAFEMKELGEATGLSEIALKLFQTQLENAKQAAEDTKVGLEALREEFLDIADAIQKLEDQAQDVELAEQFAQAARQIEFMDTRVDELTTSSEELEAALSDIAKVAGQIENIFNEIEPEKFGDAVKGVLGGLNDVFQSAFEGGGGIGGAIKSFATLAVRELGKFIPIIGGVISKFAGAIVAGFSKLFGKLFGTAGRDALRAFSKTEGGFDRLHEKLSLLGDEGERLWISLTQGVGRNDAEGAAREIAKVEAALERLKLSFEQLQAAVGTASTELREITVLTPEIEAALANVWDQTTAEGYLGAVQRLNTELDKQKQKYADIKGVLDKYGIAFENAGKGFQQSNLNERAKELKDDFDALKNSGMDINAQMRAMGGSVRDFIKDAQKAGVEVPEFMMEIIQSAIDAGEVFDDNGNKVTDITQLGLKFGTTYQEAMAKVEQAVDRLTLVLEGLAKFLGIELPKAAAAGADKIEDELSNIYVPPIDLEFRSDLPVPGSYHDETGFASRGARVTRSGLQYLGLGGFARGTDTVPAMLTPGELVINAAQQENLAGALARPLALQLSFSGPVLAEPEYIERNIVPNVLKGIQRHYMREFGRLLTLAQLQTSGAT